MDEERLPRGSHLFTVRLWAEAVGEGRAEWRGQVCHVLSGRTRSFREWTALVAFLEEVAAEDGRVSWAGPRTHGEHL